MHERYGIASSVEELIAQRGRSGPMRLTPRGKVRTIQAGPFGSAYRGRGMEFEESRSYQPGDDVRAIDWRVTARTGRVHTKLFQEERERPVLMLVDARPMMRFGTRDAFKSVLAARTAAALAWAAADSGDRVGAVIMTGRETWHFPPHRSRARMLRLMQGLSAATSDAGESEEVILAQQVARVRRVVRPGTLVFVLSDFHDFDTVAENELAQLAMRCEVACVRIHDALEAAAPASHGLRISDGEHVLSLAGFNRKWQVRYAAPFEAVTRRLESFCLRHGVTCLWLRTGQDLDATLSARFQHRGRFGAGRSTSSLAGARP
jgi:uncharacterized protein (DUF58 family)